jgi:adenylate cyclase
MKFEELGFQIAIGIASGPAVVGKIGSQDQVKVTAFGPVVNRASRIEGMNRLLNTTILIDQATCDQVLPKGEVMTLEDGQTLRSRSMGRFLPFGIGAVVEVHQLWTEPQGLSGKEVRQFDEALNSFQSGRWDECLTQVRALPANDPGRIFLENFMANYVGRPPEDWNGIVKLGAK